MKKIFIIHGWTYTLNAWDALQSSLKRLGVEPVILHVPGLSEPSTEVWTLDKYVSWLEQKLAGEQNITLLGHSNGGRIAIAFSAKNPSKVSKLILLDSAGIVHNEFGLRFKRVVFGGIARVGKKVVGSNSFLRKVFYKIIGARDYERAPKNMQETMKNLISVDLSNSLSTIFTPTLILWGENDKATPVSDARKMHDLIKNSKLVVIPDAGHSPHQSHTSKVAEEITRFL